MGRGRGRGRSRGRARGRGTGKGTGTGRVRVRVEGARPGLGAAQPSLEKEAHILAPLGPPAALDLVDRLSLDDDLLLAHERLVLLLVGDEVPLELGEGAVAVVARVDLLRVRGGD